VNQNPAHIFLPAKAYTQADLNASVAAWTAAGNASNGEAGSLFDDGQQPLQPGVAGRCLLPDADGDFDALAGLVAGVSSMAQLWVAYSLLQGILLIMLVIRCGVNCVPHLQWWELNAEQLSMQRTLAGCVGKQLLSTPFLYNTIHALLVHILHSCCSNSYCCALLWLYCPAGCCAPGPSRPSWA
jgi:hypothetical protein